MPPEVLLQIMGYLTPSDLFNIRRVSIGLANFTRFHSRYLVLSMVKSKFPLEHEILEGTASNGERMMLSENEVADRVLKLAVAAMMGENTDLYPGLMLPVLLDVHNRPKRVHHMWPPNGTDMDGNFRDHHDGWSHIRKIAWERHYNGVATRGFRYLSFLEHISRKAESCAETARWVVTEARKADPTRGTDEMLPAAKLPLAILVTWRHQLDMYHRYHARLFGSGGAMLDNIQIGSWTGPYLDSLDTATSRLFHLLGDLRIE